MELKLMEFILGLMLLLLAAIIWPKTRRQSVPSPDSISKARAAARERLKEMGLNYICIKHRALYGGGSQIIISRYACRCNGYSAKEVARLLIPAEFVARIRELFPNQEVVVSTGVITEADLKKDRKRYLAEGCNRPERRLP